MVGGVEARVGKRLGSVVAMIEEEWAVGGRRGGRA